MLSMGAMSFTAKLRLDTAWSNFSRNSWENGSSKDAGSKPAGGACWTLCKSVRSSRTAGCSAPCSHGTWAKSPTPDPRCPLDGRPSRRRGTSTGETQNFRKSQASSGVCAALGDDHGQIREKGRISAGGGREDKGTGAILWDRGQVQQIAEVGAVPHQQGSGSLAV